MELKTEATIKIENKKTVSFGGEVEQHEPVSDWAVIIFVCSAIVSFCCAYGLFLYMKGL